MNDQSWKPRPEWDRVIRVQQQIELMAREQANKISDQIDLTQATQAIFTTMLPNGMLESDVVNIGVDRSSGTDTTVITETIKVTDASELSDLDLVNELRRRKVLVSINGSEYANEKDYQHNKDLPNYLRSRQRYAVSEAARVLEEEPKRFTQQRTLAVAPGGLTLTQEEVDTGEPVHMRRFTARAWVLDLTRIGEAD